jgi:cation diffusion facilitator CzcD-associated flavoprotein CzcO
MRDMQINRARYASAATEKPSVLILGAGMSGLCMGIALKKAGFESFQILEKAAGIGGTWWDNTYPGAQCDVPSHLYSFSFELKPDWSRAYSPQAEIRDYMQHCARKYGLLPHIRCNTEVASARFDSAAGLWTLTLKNGEFLAANIFVCSGAPLNDPRLPDIPGLQDFKGRLFHTARWDNAFDFTGKRVAVIGNAASAVQLIPEIAPKVAKLFVFQRAANWIMPRPDRAFTAWERALYRLPFVARAYRAYLKWVHERHRLGLDPESAIGKLAAGFADRHLRKQVPDPELQQKLRPDYPMGCKRILLSNEYYPALQRSNVELVTTPIDHVTAQGMVTRDGELREVDTIVCATGFNATQMLSRVLIEGLPGNVLNETWNKGAEAYHGVTVAGFPNFFLLLGPNTGTGHTSTLIFIEAQVDYALDCASELMQRGSAHLDVKAAAMREHNEKLQRALSTTVWAGGCGSWYKTAEGKIVALYPGFARDYVAELKRPNFDDYEFA